MIDLADYQFELLDGEDSPDDGFGFGDGLEESVPEDGFNPGTMDWTNQDVDNATRGFTQFGEDLLQGPTWDWQSYTNREDDIGALETLGRSQTAWQARAVMREPGAVTALRYRLGGRDRRIYGRPRQFTASPSNLMIAGRIPIAKNFKCVDGYTYDDEASGITLYPHLGATPTIIFPVVLPIAASPSTDEPGPVTILGDAPTYPVVVFRGPVTNPYLQTRDWTLSLSTSIPIDEYVTVDLRPWHVTVMKNDVESIAGTLGRRVWMEDMFFEPGDNTLLFGGTGDTSGALCEVEWRSAWTSL